MPIPHNARVAHGTDRSITIVGMRGGQIERIWEMWIAGRRADGSWTSETLGVTTAAERYQHSRAYTVTASGICHMTGSLMLGETKRVVEYIRTERAAGRTPSRSHIVNIIDHPLCVAMPNPRANTISYPATFSDGSNPDPATPAEGQMIYLRPDLDIDALGLTPLKYAIAVVMQERGCYVTDRTNWNTSLMVEGDITYSGVEWAQVRDPGEDWYIVYPDDAWVIGKVYPDKAAFDADTLAAPSVFGAAPPPGTLVSYTDGPAACGTGFTTDLAAGVDVVGARFFIPDGLHLDFYATDIDFSVLLKTHTTGANLFASEVAAATPMGTMPQPLRAGWNEFEFTTPAHLNRYADGVNNGLWIIARYKPPSPLYIAGLGNPQAAVESPARPGLFRAAAGFPASVNDIVGPVENWDILYPIDVMVAP